MIKNFSEIQENYEKTIVNSLNELSGRINKGTQSAENYITISEIENALENFQVKNKQSSIDFVSDLLSNIDEKEIIEVKKRA